MADRTIKPWTKICEVIIYRSWEWLYYIYSREVCVGEKKNKNCGRKLVKGKKGDHFSAIPF
jgi:hypothetical protein